MNTDERVTELEQRTRELAQLLARVAIAVTRLEVDIKAATR
jgi:hypothetical protein